MVNADKDSGDLLKVVLLEDYNVSKAEIITPGERLQNKDDLQVIEFSFRR